MKKVLLSLLLLLCACQERSYTFDKKSNGITYRQAGSYQGFRYFDMVHVVVGGVVLENVETETLLTVKGATDEDVVLKHIRNDNETLIDKTVHTYVSIEDIQTRYLVDYSKQDVFIKDAEIEKLTIDKEANITIVDSTIASLRIKNVGRIKLINCTISEIMESNLNELVIENSKLNLDGIDQVKITMIQ